MKCSSAVNLLVTRGGVRTGTQPENFMLVLCKFCRWHVVRFKLLPDLLVVWSPVVTFQTADKAKLKHTVKCVRLINIKITEKS